MPRSRSTALPAAPSDTAGSTPRESGSGLLPGVRGGPIGQLLGRLGAAPECRARRGGLGRYLLLTYVVLSLSAISLVRDTDLSHVASAAHVLAVLTTYCAFYALIAVGPALLLNESLRAGWIARTSGARWAVLGLALGSGSVVQLLLLGDGIVFRMYGFHLNGFVWNLVSTPGGIESMGADGATVATTVALALGIVALQTILLTVAFRSAGLRRRAARAFPPRRIAAVVLVLLGLSAAERFAYGVSSLRAYEPVLSVSGVVPFYARLRMRSLGHMLGIEQVHDGSVRMSAGSGAVNYPLSPLVRSPDAKDLNVVWLVAESLRADAMHPEIMPETVAFAERGQWFRNHYSGGNGTRMGMFALFYGLYGTYWFPFLEARQTPAVMDAMIDADYDVEVFTSAKFTFPEFDKTIFRRVPPELRHEGDPDRKGSRNDRDNVTRLIESIETRSPEQPFMRFLFFESAHAPYTFPKTSVIRRPYKRTMNYVTMDLEDEIVAIHNRYLNACHHLDLQLGRVLTYLDESGLLDSTIVIVTGDHGEEFMEKGHWGHHSTFVEEQIRTPLVMWMPGRPAEQVYRFSSHLDVSPTVLAALGVTTPAEDLSLGHDLYGTTVRHRVVVADWKRLAIIDERQKIVAPVRDAALGGGYVTTADDVPIDDPTPVYAEHRRDMLDVLRDLSRFGR
jgi:uncharacterized protein